MISPYAAFNLKRNPFGELTQAERAQLAVVGDELTKWLEFLSRPNQAIQFLGAEQFETSDGFRYASAAQPEGDPTDSE